MTKKVSVIIVSHNNRDILPRNLDALRKQSFRNFEVFIVDNDSNDGTEKFIRENYPEVNFITISAGVDRKRNLAASKSSSKYIVTLDSDAILTKDWIKNAVRYMDEHKDVGVCCCKMLNKEGLIDYAGTLVAKNGGTIDIGHNEEDKPGYNTFKRIAGMTTAVSIIRREAFEDVGGFDENYYYGYEDTDFGLRANFAGWKVVYNPDLLAYHYYHSTLSKENKKFNWNIDFHVRKNRLLTLLKNFEFRTLLLNFPFIFMTLFFDLTKRNLTATIKAYFWILFNFQRILKLREDAFKRKKVSDKTLFDIIYFPLTTRNYNKQKKILEMLRKANSRVIKDITFFITTKCNSKCKHCFYWKSLNKEDLSLEQIEKIISKFFNIYSVSLSGGEPFIRKDLNDIIRLIVKYMDVKVIDIPTNCLLDIADKLEKILKENRLVCFSIDCSLDGLREEHDYIRGINGSFEKTIKTIYKLAELKKKYKNFKNLSVNTVLTNRNYKDMPELINFVKKLPVDNHTFDIIRGSHQQILSMPTIEQIKKFNKLRYKTRRYYNRRKGFLARIYQNLRDKSIIKTQERILKGKKWKFCCTAGKTDLVIESDGALRICELTKKIGSLLKNTPEEILSSEEAKKIFKCIKKHKCDCTHICNITFSLSHNLKNII